MSAFFRSLNRRGLAFKLSLLILASTAGIFLLAFGYNYIQSRKVVLRNLETNARNLTLATANRIEAILQSVEKNPRLLAAALGRRQMNREQLRLHMEDLLTSTPEVFSCKVAFEPGAFHPSRARFSLHVSREVGEFKHSSLESESVDYSAWDWYILPRELGRPVWSEPYFDEGGSNTMIATYSVPIFYGDRGREQFAGVVTAEMSLEQLKYLFSQVAIYRTGYAFMISKNGTFISHPHPNWVLAESIFSLAEATGEGILRQVGREMINGKEGFVSLRSVYTGKLSYLYYGPLASAGWSIGVMIPEDELFADLRHLNRTVLLIGGVGFVFLLAVVVLIASTITGPLRRLAAQTSEIARGGLDVEILPTRSRDEVGELTASFENMRLALKEYIRNLRETTAAKERIESELKIARTIQMSFLPRRFPPFPEKKELGIFGTLEPAREVGGDFYDFFLVGEDHLFFSIGDAAGKGVPAAFFMAVARTLIKGTALLGLDPAEVLARVNLELCRDNDSAMFVTLACGSLNFRTGELHYSNAGHNPPVLTRSGGPADWLPLPEGLVLGAMEDAPFETKKIQLAPGDRLLLYTDGVTEAMNAGGALYSAERLLKAVERFRALPPEEFVRKVTESVREFADPEPQSDDLTLLALEYRG